MDLLRMRPDMNRHPLGFLSLVAIQSVLLFLIWMWKRITRWPDD